MLRRRSTLERHNLVLQHQIPLKSRVWTQRFIPDTGACRVLPDASLNLEVAVITMLSPLDSRACCAKIRPEGETSPSTYTPFVLSSISTVCSDGNPDEFPTLLTHAFPSHLVLDPHASKSPSVMPGVHHFSEEC